MLSDLKFAIRQLRKSPAFALTAILTLAIGIGVNTAIFSVMDAIVLRPLAIPNMNRVVTVYDAQTAAGDYPVTAIGKYEDWLQQGRSFESLAVHTNKWFTLTGAGNAAHIQAAAVSANFFDLLRTRPLLGRTFRPDETQSGHDGEVVLSYAFWQHHFSGDEAVIGKNIELDGRAFTVIGVMPKLFSYPSAADLFVPLALTPQQLHSRADRNYLVIGRLKPGVTVQAAQAEMDSIATRLAKLYPATNLGWHIKVVPLLDNINGSLTPLYMRMIMAATVFVLLIVCANLANLQFARGLGRQNEMAVRTALGAQHFRLVRQLLAESVLLGLVGAAGGLLLAKLDLRILVHTMPPLIARYVAGWSRISLDDRALAFSLVLAIGAGVLSGLAPALESLRLNLVDQLKSGSRTATTSGRTHRLRNIFVVAQIALAVALVIGAALMVKGLDAMFHRSDKYEPAKVLTFGVSLPSGHYGTPQKQAEWYEQSLSKIQSLPGVKAAVITTALPEGNDGTWNDSFRIDSHPVVPGQIQNAARLAVSAGYFSIMHIPVVAGHAFTASDGLNTTPVALVSRNFAVHYFPNTSPLGHKIRFGSGKNDNEPWVTIVGIVGNVRYQWTDDLPEPAIYLNAAQVPPGGAKYAVLTNGDPLAVAPAVRRALAAIDPALALDAMMSYAEYLREGLIGLTNAAAMLAVDALIALLLAGIGIFGVMANLVGERRREIGVRLTMGATQKNVVQLFLRRAVFLLGMGLIIGVPLAAALARAVANLLYGVHPGDIAVFVAATVAIAGITLLAAYLPAHRAAQVDPVESLRSE
jgi:putative ABC transport system permease protein